MSNSPRGHAKFCCGSSLVEVRDEHAARGDGDGDGEDAADQRELLRRHHFQAQQEGDECSTGHGRRC